MSGRPDVSVVIPTKNRADFLPDAVQTALAQENVDVEVIVVDDGSDDETPALLAAAAADPRVRAVRFDPSRGQCAARNAGIEAARGAWIAFLDDDDLWAPDKLRLQLEAARHAGATWAYCGVLLVSPEGDVVRASGPPDPATVLPELLRANVVQAGASTVVVDAERLRALGGFEDGLSTPWDLWIRLAADGPAAAVYEPLVAYRRHSSSFVTASRATAIAEARRVAERHRLLSREHGVEFDLAHYDRWLDSELVRALRTQAVLRLDGGQRLDAARLQLRVVARTRSWPDVRRLLRIAFGDTARRAFRRARPPAPAGEREPIPAWLAPYLEKRGCVLPSSSSTPSAGTSGTTSSLAKNTLNP